MGKNLPAPAPDWNGSVCSGCAFAVFRYPGCSGPSPQGFFRVIPLAHLDLRGIPERGGAGFTGRKRRPVSLPGCPSSRSYRTSLPSFRVAGSSSVCSGVDLHAPGHGFGDPGFVRCVFRTAPGPTVQIPEQGSVLPLHTSGTQRVSAVSPF